MAKSAGGVLRLDPVRRAARNDSRNRGAGNDTFEAELASVLEHDRAIPRSAVARAQGPRDHLSSGEMNSKEAIPLTAPKAPVTLATYPRCPAIPGASQSPVT